MMILTASPILTSSGMWALEFGMSTRLHKSAISAMLRWESAACCVSDLPVQDPTGVPAGCRLELVAICPVQVFSAKVSAIDF